MKKICNKLVSIFALIIMFAICSGFASAFSVSETANAMNQTSNDVSASYEADLENYEEVFSYKSVFRIYYDEAASIAEERNAVICSFDEFCDNYYEADMDLPTYTESVAYNLIDENDLNAKVEFFGSSIDWSAAGSTTAGYIMSSQDYDVTPESEFLRKPIYNSSYKNLFLTIQAGDMVYETKYNGGHIAIVYNVFKRSDYGNYIQTIEAVGGTRGGVNFGFLDDTRLVDFKAIMLRVKGATSPIVDKVKYFCSQQLGKEYSVNHSLQTSIDSEKWYCSELAYAAYLYAGIDIVVQIDSSGKETYPSKKIYFPVDIYYGTNVTTIGLYMNYLTLSNEGKSGSYWKIRVRNPTSQKITVDYNSKMCDYDDGEDWKNLKHISTISISAYGSELVEIKTNFLATSVAFSYCVNGKRLITCGHKLNKNGNIVMYTNTINC